MATEDDFDPKTGRRLTLGESLWARAERLAEKARQSKKQKPASPEPKKEEPPTNTLFPQGVKVSHFTTNRLLLLSKFSPEERAAAARALMGKKPDPPKIEAQKPEPPKLVSPQQKKEEPTAKESLAEARANFRQKMEAVKLASSQPKLVSPTIGYVLGETMDWNEPVGIDHKGRCSGLYILGKPGMGKSTLLVNLLCQDLREKNSIFFLDPHGEAVTDVFKCSPELRVAAVNQRVFLLDPTDEKYAFGINPLSCANTASLAARTEAYTRTYNIFQKIWEKDWGVWLQLVLENTLLVFVENQHYTLADVPLFLTNKAFRNHLLQNVRYSRRAIDFWKNEFKPDQAQAALTRIRSFLSHDYVSHIVGQKQTTIDFDTYTTSNWFVFLRLSASLPQDIKTFIGTIITSELMRAIRNRSAAARKSLYGLYVDEFQHFATDPFADFILEGRKYGCAVTLAHQNRESQFGENAKILGATATTVNKVLFQVAVKDAKEFAPEFARLRQEVDDRQEAVLVPSTQAVENVWDRGHPETAIMDARQRYFWLVQSLRTQPKEKYFQFNPNNIPHTTDRYPVAEKDFDDWMTYRSSSSMITEGIALLNQYYYGWMTHKYDKHTYISDNELQLLRRVIICLGGVLGYRPTMFPCIPAIKARLFEHAITRSFIQLEQENLAILQNRRRLPNADQWQLQQAILKVESKIEKLRKDGAGVFVSSGFFHPKDITNYQVLAIREGMASRDVEDLVEWELFPTDREEKFIDNLIRLMVNCKVDRAFFDNHVKDICWGYTTALARYYILFKYQREFDWEALDLFDPYQMACKRAMWQVSYMCCFIEQCRHVGKLLEETPIQIQSGQYVSKPMQPRSVADMVSEMAQLLSDTPSYFAWAKMATEVEGEQSVWKGMIRTFPLPEIVNDHRELEKRVTLATRQRCCMLREVVEEGMWERQRNWRSSDEPPPTSS